MLEMPGMEPACCMTHLNCAQGCVQGWGVVVVRWVQWLLAGEFGKVKILFPKLSCSFRVLCLLYCRQILYPLSHQGSPCSWVLARSQEGQAGQKSDSYPSKQFLRRAGPRAGDSRVHVQLQLTTLQLSGYHEVAVTQAVSNTRTWWLVTGAHSHGSAKDSESRSPPVSPSSWPKSHPIQAAGNLTLFCTVFFYNANVFMFYMLQLPC